MSIVFTPPFAENTISSKFGPRWHPVHGGWRNHDGVDFALPTGTPVKAAAPGTVIFVGTYTAGWGLTVRIDHGGGWITQYNHLQRGSFRVNRGQRVSRGQVIANVNNTGTSSGPHLDWNVIRNGRYVNPLNHSSWSRTGGSVTTGIVAEDGVGGPASAKEFQKFLGVPVTGKWDRATVRRLQQYLNKAGFKGLDNKVLVEDGLGFGNNWQTRIGPTNTIAAFQRSQGTHVDGILDKGGSPAIQRAQQKINQGKILFKVPGVTDVAQYKKIAVDGWAGDGTAEQFQRWLGLEPTRKWDRATVRKLQHRLNDGGYRDKNGNKLDTDGKGFGSNYPKSYGPTRTVEAFQAAMGTPVDGILGAGGSPAIRKAQEALNDKRAPFTPKKVTPSKPAPSAPAKGITEDGIAGEATARLFQPWLGVPVTGVWDRATVRRLQVRLNAAGHKGLNGRALDEDGLGFGNNWKYKLGPNNTIAAFQRAMGTFVDGVLDKGGSPAIKVAQQRLNKGEDLFPLPSAKPKPTPKPTPKPETKPTPEDDTASRKFSNLTKRTLNSDKSQSREGHEIEYFIIHHTGNVGNEGNENYLATNAAKVSANYVLRTDGTWTGLVPEYLRAWTTGWDADKNGVTVETVNTDMKGGVSPLQLEALAQMAADLSQYYGWGMLTRDNVRIHSDFMNTSCPGPVITKNIGNIINRANNILFELTDSVPTEHDLVEFDEYVVEAGDTFWAIAKELEIEIDDILEANPTVNPSELSIGQKVFIPVTTHTVASGDILVPIATKYGVSVADLKARNVGVDLEKLQVGSTIRIR